MLQRTLARGTRWAVTRRMARNLSPPVLEAFEALGEACGVDPELLTRAHLMPETFTWLINQWRRIPGVPSAPGMGAPPSYGSTSLLRRAPHGLLHGYNLDYFGANYWERYATVTFYRPDRGFDYAAVGSAGFLGAGCAAMNAAGLTLGAHQRHTTDLDVGGVSIGPAADAVMRSAATIEQAIAALRRYRPVSAWTYVLGEGETGRVALVTRAPGDESIWELPPDHTTLSFVHEEPGQDPGAAALPPGWRRILRGRAQRAEALADELASAPFGAEAIAAGLADMRAPGASSTPRLMGPNIANVHTVGSVVFDPARRRLWVGAGPTPSSRGWFIPLDLARGEPDLDVLPFSPTPDWKESSHGKAFEFYRQAHYRALEREAPERLLILIEHALAHWPDDPDLHALCGLLAIKAGRAQRAEGALRRALELAHGAARRAELGLYLAWSLDIQGQRMAARHLYKKLRASTDASAPVARQAARLRWTGFGAAGAHLIPIDMTLARAPL